MVWSSCTWCPPLTRLGWSPSFLYCRRTRSLLCGTPSTNSSARMNMRRRAWPLRNRTSAPRWRSRPARRYRKRLVPGRAQPRRLSSLESAPRCGAQVCEVHARVVQPRRPAQASVRVELRYFRNRTRTLNLAVTGSAWWRRRELNPRPKQLPPGLLRACPRFWFSLGGSSRRDPLLPAAVTVLPQGRGAPVVAIRSM